MTNPLNTTHLLELYREEKSGQFRWRRRAGNNRIISVSGEGYNQERDALHGMRIANADHEQVRFLDRTKESPREEPDSPSS